MKKLLLFTFGFWFAFWANAQGNLGLNWIEPGIYQYRGISEPVVNSFLVLQNDSQFVVINPQINTVDNKLMITILKQRLPDKKLSAVYLTDSRVTSFANANLLASSFGTIPVYATAGIQSEMEAAINYELLDYLKLQNYNIEVQLFPTKIAPPKIQFQFGELDIIPYSNTHIGSGAVYFNKASKSMFAFGFLDTSIQFRNPKVATVSRGMQSDLDLLNHLIDLNPERVFSSRNCYAFPRFDLVLWRNQLTEFQSVYFYRLANKMNLKEFYQSVPQNFNSFYWLPPQSQWDLLYNLFLPTK